MVVNHDPDPADYGHILSMSRAEFAEHVDVFPTICDLLRVEIPAPVQGRSLVPLLGGAPTPADWRDAVFSQIGDHVMVRTAEWKLNVYGGEPGELYDLRKVKQPPISGAQTLSVMVAATSMPPEPYNKLLRTLIDDLSKTNGTGSYRARLMIVGSELDDPEYIEIIEAQGGLVVTDSICFGTRTMWVDVNEKEPDPVLALARYYIQERPSCPRMNEDQHRRAKFLRELIREFDVNGVIGERMLFCDFWCAEHYMNSADLKEFGVPFIQIDREYILSGKGQLQTRIQAFLETMGK